jgi:hypothetical protein
MASQRMKCRVRPTTGQGRSMEAAASSLPAAARRSAFIRPVPRGVDAETTNNHLSDLLEAVGKERDRAAFAELFRRLAPVVTRLLLGRGASPSMAEELLQETMRLVWRHAATFDRSRASASTCVSAIARNRHLDIVRAAKRSIQEGHEPRIEIVPDDERRPTRSWAPASAAKWCAAPSGPCLGSRRRCCARRSTRSDRTDRSPRSTGCRSAPSNCGFGWHWRISGPGSRSRSSVSALRLRAGRPVKPQ